jgi:type I restriction enzyme, S subunit
MTTQDLPMGWVSACISEISAKCEQRTPEEIEEFIYVDIGSIDRKLKIIATPQTLNGHEAPSRARKIINTGDVLVSLTRPNLNAVALVPAELNDQIASTGFEVIKPVAVDVRYIFSITRSDHFIEAISGAVQGALYPAAKSSDVQNYTIPLPPLAEQKEIADRLDKLLDQVEATQARLARIPDIIKRFRQSVLAAAVSGKLTEEWRESNKLPLPKEVKLEQIICEGPQNGLYKAQSFYGEGVRIIRIDGFYDGEIVGWDKVKRLSLEDVEYSRWKLDIGDILVNRVNSIEYLGKSAIVRELPEPAVFESNIMKFRVNADEATPEYIVKYLCSITGLSQLRQNAKLAVNQASINQQDVKNCSVYLPVPQEQTEIVRRVDQLFAYADTLEQQAKAAKERVDKLTQAILAKAFRGELTADWRAANPDLISGDNSAASLLARIQAERTAAKPRKRATKPAISPTSSGVTQ